MQSTKSIVISDQPSSAKPKKVKAKKVQLPVVVKPVAKVVKSIPYELTVQEVNFLNKFFLNMMTCEKPFRLPRFVNTPTVSKKNELMFSIPETDQRYNAVLIDPNNVESYFRYFVQNASPVYFCFQNFAFNASKAFGSKVYITPLMYQDNTELPPVVEAEIGAVSVLQGRVDYGSRSYHYADGLLSVVLSVTVQQGRDSGTTTLHIGYFDSDDLYHDVFSQAITLTTNNTTLMTLSAVVATGKWVIYLDTTYPNYTLSFGLQNGLGLFDNKSGFTSKSVSLFDAAKGSKLMSSYHAVASKYALCGSTLWLQNTSNVLSKDGRLVCAQVPYDSKYLEMTPQQLFDYLSISEGKLYQGDLSEGVFRCWTPSSFDLLQFRPVSQKQIGDLLIVAWDAADFVDVNGNSTTLQLTIHSNCVLEYQTSDTFDTPRLPPPELNLLLSLFYWYYGDPCTENPKHLSTMVAKIKHVVAHPAFQAAVKTMVPVLIKAISMLA